MQKMPDAGKNFKAHFVLGMLYRFHARTISRQHLWWIAAC